MSPGASRLSVRFPPPGHSFASTPFPSFLVRDVITLQRTLFATSPCLSIRTSSGLLPLLTSFAILGEPTLAVFTLISGTPNPAPDLVISPTAPSPWQEWPRQFLLLVSTRAFPSVLDALSGVTRSLLVFPCVPSVPSAAAPTPRTIINPWHNVVRVLPRRIPLFLPLGKGFHALTLPLV